MAKIVFVDHLGKRYEAEAQVGRTLMQVALDHAIPGILGDCGGACSCATCHAYIDPSWIGLMPNKSETEMFMLEAVLDEQPTSRLCCQIKVKPEFNGLMVRVPAEEA